MLPLRTDRKARQNTKTPAWYIREPPRQPGLEESKFWEEGASEEKWAIHSLWEQGKRLRIGAGGPHRLSLPADRETSRACEKLLGLQGPKSGMWMARFLVRREKQRTEPDAAGFPLQMFAELRRCVGLKTKNKGRKPLKSRKYFFVTLWS